MVKKGDLICFIPDMEMRQRLENQVILEDSDISKIIRRAVRKYLDEYGKKGSEI